MGARVRFGLLAGTLIAINIAGLAWIRHELTGRGQPRIRLLSVLPQDNIDAADRFSLLFDEPIVEPAEVGVPETASPFVIEPPPSGHWTWSRTDRLEFLLDRPLPAGRVFTIRPAVSLEARTGRVLVGQAEYRFQTRPLAAESCQVVSSDRGDFTLELTFNQPVAPGDLLRQIQVQPAGSSETLAATCLTSEPAVTLLVRCPRPDKDEVAVLIRASLTGAGAELPLDGDATFTVTIPTTFALLRADVRTPGIDRNVVVDLEFSSSLDGKQATPAVRLSPAVEGLQARLSYGQIRLEGPFACGQKYTAAVSGEVRSKEGQTLGSEQTVTFEIPDRQPSLAFPVSHGILAPAGQMLIDLQAVNIAGLKLKAHRVHANNLASHVRGDAVEVTARELRETTLPLKIARNDVAKLALDLRSLLGSEPGAYVVCAEATDRSWTDDTAIITVSDLGITTKQEQDGCLVWVTSIRTAKPLPGVHVAAVTRNNQALASALTGPDGLARLSVPAEHPDGDIWLVTAQSGEDLNFLVPEDETWQLDSADTAGRTCPRTYDVLLYAERGVYRPGETIRLTGLLRDATGHVPPPFPLSLTVRRPDDRKVLETVITPAGDAQGFFHAEYVTREDGQLGGYTFEVSLPGAKEVLGKTAALVEDFVPQRLAVTAEPAQPRFGPQEAPAVQVHARYLFGQPGSDLPVEVTGHYERVCFESQRFPDYRFEDPDAGKEIPIPDAEATLDDAGQARIDLPLGKQNKDAAPARWQASVCATVTEPGGRSLSRYASCIVDRTERYIGLRAPESRLLRTGQPIAVEWVQVTGADEPAVPAAMTFTLDRVEHDMNVEQVDGRYVWKSIERLTNVRKGEMAVEPSTAAQGSFEITCDQPGRYRLQVVDSQTQQKSRIEFHVTADGQDDGLLASDQPERVEIVLDRERYTPGMQARALVKSPFAGLLLVTLETRQIVEYRIIEMTSTSAEVSLPVTEQLRGGGFVTASVIQPVDPSREKWMPHRAAGIARLAVDHKAHALPVTIEAPPQARPGQTVTVTVRTPAPADGTGPAVVHLWAVDEGILQLTRFETPDPAAHFLADRAATVITADGFGSLLPDYQRPASMTRIGGGDGGMADMVEYDPDRQGLLPVQRRQSAVIWRTVAPVSQDGTLSVDVQLPDATGELRWMAVAAGEDLYGHAARPLTLAAPLMLEASWPRFAAPDDRFEVPLKVFNTTEQPMQVRLVLARVEGSLQVRLPDETTVEVQPKQPATVWLKVTATGMGSADVDITATAEAGGEIFTALARANLPVRPATALHREVRLHRVRAGEPLKIDPPAAFLSETVRATVSVGARPTVQLQPALEQLIDYPYGCAEQTTSRLLALMYVPDLLPQDGRTAAIGEMIDAGIARLWAMQTRSGGLSYWPGDWQDDPWGSAYAAAFLLRARQAGYRVNPQFADPLVEYLESKLQGDLPSDAANIRALLCAVLAGFGKPAQGWMDRLAERPDLLDMAGRAHLASAYLATGRKDRALAVLKDDTIRQAIATTTANRLTSQVAQQAELLHVLLDLDRDHPWIAPLVSSLEKARTGGQWGSTLENAGALAALARYQKLGQASAAFEGTLRCGSAEPVPFTHEAALAHKVNPLTDAIEIASSGEGDLYVSVAFEGLLRQGQAEPYDRQLTVRRRWLDRHNKEIDPAALSVGDLVQVELTVQATGLADGEEVANVAVVDALPAGLEIENPRLSSAGAPDAEPWDVPDPQRVEFRDDRVLAFVTVSKKPQVHRYWLRAITAGTFALPPVQGSCMYDPRFASLNGGGKVEITR